MRFSFVKMGIYLWLFYIWFRYLDNYVLRLYNFLIVLFFNNDSLIGEKIWYYILIIFKSIVRILLYIKLVVKL